jgi:hypothetical protein
MCINFERHSTSIFETIRPSEKRIFKNRMKNPSIFKDEAVRINISYILFSEYLCTYSHAFLAEST